jgi:hypothetical protein
VAEELLEGHGDEVSEMITVYYGEDTPSAGRRGCATGSRKRYGACDVSVYLGATAVILYDRGE